MPDLALPGACGEQPALAGAHAAPDAVALVVAERVVEARLPHLAPLADRERASARLSAEVRFCARDAVRVGVVRSRRSVCGRRAQIADSGTPANRRSPARRAR